MRLSWSSSLVVIATLVLAACQTGGDRAARPRQSTPVAVGSIPGVTAECAAAVAARNAGTATAARDFQVILRCDSEDELRAAALGLGDVELADHAALFVEDMCYAMDYPATPICPPRPTPTPEPRPTPEPPPTPSPTPEPVPAWEDTAFQERAIERCKAGRPAKLYSVTAGVSPLADPPAVGGVYVQLVEYTDLDGRVVSEPNLERGYVYDTDIHSGVEFATDVDLIGCLALRAVERELWYPEHQSGCPCSTYAAADALVWMVYPRKGRLLGKPWLRPPADVDGGEHTNMLLGGADDDPGVRPPEPEDIRADIEAFLGR